MNLDDLRRATDPAKANKRKQARYLYAIKKGFTSAEAALLRNYSEAAIDKLAEEKKMEAKRK